MNNQFKTAMPPPYPIDAFHFLVRNAIDEVQRNVMAPDALIGMSFLSVMSIACQGLIDVKLPKGEVKPVSLNILVKAESGERKTTVDNIVAAPISAHDEAALRHHDERMREYKIILRAWKTVDAAIRSKITKSVKEGCNPTAYYQELVEHAKSEPVKPSMQRIIYQNSTDSALMEAINGDGKSIAIMSDEGEVVLRGGLMNKTGVRNKGWDGPRILVMDRVTTGSSIARNPRVTTSIMVQNAVFDAYMEKHSVVSRGSGHWARYLVGDPASTQGFRFIDILESTWKFLPAFHERVGELLNHYDTMVDSGIVARKVVEFDDDAKVEWVRSFNFVEGQIQPWQYLNDVHDFAAKAMEIVARVAAIFHVFTKQEGNITVDTLNRAKAIVEWHIHEFKRMFSPDFQVPQIQLDMQAIANYLFRAGWSMGYTFVARNHVLHCGPVRNLARFNAALDAMVYAGQIWIGQDPKSKRRFINLNGQFFGAMPSVLVA